MTSEAPSAIRRRVPRAAALSARGSVASPWRLAYGLSAKRGNRAPGTLMPTIDENSDAWGHYDWSRGGHEWSEAWGGTEALWWGTLFPRIRPFVPCETLLEIAPGFGRCTRYLKDLCRRMFLVDLSERCMEACRERFATESHIAFHVNDGRSLAAVPDRSVDFAFSYDSLVHAESDVMEAYVADLARTLAADGVAFLHHSSLGRYRDPSTGLLRVENVHWRAESMTPDALVEACDRSGLHCASQEVLAWGGKILTDCFSVLTRPGSRFARPFRRVENERFMEEPARLFAIAELYGLTPGEPGPGAGSGST